MLKERSVFFLEVKEWITQAPVLSLASDTPHNSNELCDPSGYCSHCGGCCEIASGLPEFPFANAIPHRWRRVFGEGLGRGHRFCPFVWEFEGSGSSHCAIHPWRPTPCRLFEQDECEVLRRDSDYINLSHPDEFRKGYRVLLQLLKSG